MNQSQAVVELTWRYDYFSYNSQPTKRSVKLYFEHLMICFNKCGLTFENAVVALHLYRPHVFKLSSLWLFPEPVPHTIRISHTGRKRRIRPIFSFNNNRPALNLQWSVLKKCCKWILNNEVQNYSELFRMLLQEL